MTLNIDLTGTPQVDPDTDYEGWWIDGTTITERTEGFLATTKLPKCQRVTMMHFGNGKARLSIGSLDKVRVTVTGPTRIIRDLRTWVI